MSSRNRQLVFVVAFSLIFWTVVLFQVVTLRYHGDVRGLLILGSKFQHPAQLADAPRTGPEGYDGQFFAALATDPFLLRGTTAQYLDIPAYRAGRIGLPLAAWVITAGNPSISPTAYQVLCWLGALAGIWVAALWLTEEQSSPLWALPLIISAALVSSILRCLPDAAAAGLVLTALWLYRHNRLGPALLMLIFGSLVRETGLIAAVAIGIEEVRNRKFSRAAILVGVPMLAAAAWKLSVLYRLGTNSSGMGVDAHGTPAIWAADKLSRSLPPAAVIGAALLTVAVIALVPSLIRWRTWGAVEYTYALFGGLGMFANRFLSLDFDALRIIAVLPLLAVPLSALETNRIPRLFLRSVPIFFGLAGTLMMARRVG